MSTFWRIPSSHRFNIWDNPFCRSSSECFRSSLLLLGLRLDDRRRVPFVSQIRIRANSLGRSWSDLSFHAIFLFSPSVYVCMLVFHLCCSLSFAS
jgi:hypothetical protein